MYWLNIMNIKFLPVLQQYLPSQPRLFYLFIFIFRDVRKLLNTNCHSPSKISCSNSPKIEDKTTIRHSSIPATDGWFPLPPNFLPDISIDIITGPSVDSVQTYISCLYYELSNAFQTRQVVEYRQSSKSELA